MPSPQPTAKATMDPNFEKRHREASQHAKEEYEKGQKGEQVKWERPENFDADFNDWESLSKPFDRTKANEDYVKAVSTPSAPGTTGDDIITVTMIEDLACQERAFRQRHLMSRPRAYAQMLGRKRGHGDPLGPIIGSIEYIRGLLQQSASPLS